MNDVEARREARQRKILENSAKRLQKITGVQERNGSYELEGYRNTNGNIPESTNSFFSLDESLQNGNSDLLIEPVRPVSVQASHIQKYDFILEYRVHVVIFIAILTNVLLCLPESSINIFVNTIFVPLLCYEAIVIFYCPRKSNTGILNLLGLFKEPSRSYVTYLLNYLVIFKAVFTDVLIYFFVFVCILYVKSIFL